MEVYLTDTIVIKENKIFCDDKLVKKHNWHIKLEELGWSKLSKQWISKLNKLHNPYKNNSLFGALECGDDGDCLFHCIATALNSQNKDYYESKDIRKELANSITVDQYNYIISFYRSMKDIDDFDEEWDPYEIKSLDDFKQQLMQSGHAYWGDYLILQLINQIFKVNLFILTQNDIDDIYEPYPLALYYDECNPTIILLHENSSHFKLIGHFQGVMNTYFTNNTLPLEIKRLFTLK